MSREQLYEAAGKAFAESNGAHWDKVAPEQKEWWVQNRGKAAVDAVLAAMERQDAMSYLQVVNPGDKFRYSLTVDEPGTYLVYGPIKEGE